MSLLSTFADHWPRSEEAKRFARRTHIIHTHRSCRRRLLLELLEHRQMLAADLLYIGDNSSDSIQQYDSTTGAFVGTLVASGVGGLHGPRGMVVVGDHLLVVNQNVDTELNGEILRFNRLTGALLSDLVPSIDINAPFTPRGIVVRDNVAYVADFQGLDHARIAKFDVTNGEFLGDLVPTGFAPEFQPRGLVFGPDGGLYVSVSSEALFDTVDPSGYILRFDTERGTSEIVAKNDGDQRVDSGEAANLHNPEGMVFSPDGSQIYVTSNRTNLTSSIDENTRIVVIDAASGNELRSIELNPNTTKSTSRIYAQALAFGPDDKLYIPTTNVTFGEGPFGGVFNTVTGGVLKYDPVSNTTSTFIETSLSAPTLEVPFYLTFGQTDPATLAYQASTSAPVAPVLAGVETTSLAYVQNDQATIVSKTLTVSDADSTLLNGATIRITAGYRSGQDILSLGGPASTIQSSWNATTGTLTLSGNASLAKYQGALRCILYENTSASPSLGQRTVEFRATDGGLNSNVLTRKITVSASSSSATLASLSSPQFLTNSFPVNNSVVQSTSVPLTIAQLQAVVPIPLAATTQRTSPAESEDVTVFDNPSTPRFVLTQPTQSRVPITPVEPTPATSEDAADSTADEDTLGSAVKLFEEVS